MRKVRNRKFSFAESRTECQKLIYFLQKIRYVENFPEIEISDEILKTHISFNKSLLYLQLIISLLPSSYTYITFRIVCKCKLIKGKQKRFTDFLRHGNNRNLEKLTCRFHPVYHRSGQKEVPGRKKKLNDWWWMFHICHETSPTTSIWTRT